MPFSEVIVDSVRKPSFSIRIVITFLLIVFHGYTTPARADNNVYRNINIGAIVDVESRIGKEVTTAVDLSVQKFNSNNSNNFKLHIHFKNSTGNPLQAVLAANELIEGNEVQAIMDVGTWQEAALVAEAGNKAQTPVLSFAAPAVMPPSRSRNWPFLLQIATNETGQIKCVADIISWFKWRKIIAIYEDEPYGGDSKVLSLLTESLQQFGSEIEYSLALPPLSHLIDPKEALRDELTKLREKQSRVFVVFHSSLSLATHLFSEAKDVGLTGRDTVWILTESVASLLDTVNSSVISSIEGALGIKTYYPEENKAYQDFFTQFRRIFRSNYPDEDNSEPGIHALRAYDAMTTITNALEKLQNNNITSKALFDTISLSNFSGLSGKILFKKGVLLQNSTFTIINVVGKRYKELGYWSQGLGFSKERNGNDTDIYDDMVNWPGNIRRVPKGWAMPTDAKRMRIGVPGRTSFEKFVKVTDGPNNKYSGFCIDVFLAVHKILEQSYPLPYEFVPYNGTYNDLIDHVINKTFDAVVGDITILANRSKYVEFTQPFAESGLSMVVPVKSEDYEKAWMFMKPFTLEMWIVTGAVFVYTMLVVWFLEHRSNPEFRGPFKYQLGTALWFTFSSIFFAHREKIQSNLTRMVVVVWFFVVFILTSSYTASLTSMLTVQKLQPNVTDIDWLKRSNSIVGCDGDSFVNNYLINVLNFNENNIRKVTSEYNYDGEFKNRSITAAFFELPYAKVFTNKYCTGYTAINPTYRFGGFGFVFQKGSPIAADASEAILTLSENGTLRKIEEDWLYPPSECSTSETTIETESLSLQSFWGLYLISGATSTICFLLFCFHVLKNFRKYENQSDGSATPTEESVWIKTKKLAQYFHNGEIKIPDRNTAAVFAQRKADEWISPRWVYVSTSATPEHPHASPSTEIEMAQTSDDNL